MLPTPENRTGAPQVIHLKPSAARIFIETCLKARQPVMVHGRPGVGKSQIHEQITQDWKWRLWDLRLSLLDNVDLRGVPYVEERTTFWATPTFLPRPEDGPGILFIDEINRAMISTLNAMLQVATPPWRLGEYELPEQVCISAAGNYESDGGGGLTRLPDALRYRFAHVYIEPDVDDWCRKDAHAAGYLSRLPCYNTLFNYFENEDLTPLLKELVTITSLPLAAVEQDFAVDSSGFSTCRYTRWFDTKHGDVPMEKHEWMKVHLMCGVKTNVVTAVAVTDKDTNDSPLLPSLVATTRQHFTLSAVSADKQYSSKNNLRVIDEAGALPLIPFKENATGGTEAGTLWKRMYHYYSFQREAFLAQYHKRSNVESTFFMVKAKFGEALRSKSQVAQFNEALLKVLC